MWSLLKFLVPVLTALGLASQASASTGEAEPDFAKLLQSKGLIERGGTSKSSITPPRCGAP